jgi:hypothetical protein
LDNPPGSIAVQIRSQSFDELLTSSSNDSEPLPVMMPLQSGREAHVLERSVGEIASR